MADTQVIEIKLKLSIDQTNLIFKALETLPFRDVCALINTIKEQADSCVAEANKPVPQADEPSPSTE